ncbi:protein kinase-like domain, concanavalin A-like lectin/glucanase domain protein [Tanacetum coccineum]
MEELGYHEWLLKNPRPSWVRAKIRSGNLNNIKISCMIGHFLKIQAYIDLELPINVMSRQHHKWIMSKGLESSQKPSNPSKNSNFIGRVRGLKVFLGNFTYECDFMVLEDTTSIIDHNPGEVVFGKPFIRETGLVYDKKEGTVVFEKENEKITFKMPHKMEMFNHMDFKDINTDSIPPLVLENDDDHGKTYYSNSLIIGPEYKQDESDIFDKEKPGSS